MIVTGKLTKGIRDGYKWTFHRAGKDDPKLYWGNEGRKQKAAGAIWEAEESTKAITKWAKNATADERKAVESYLKGEVLPTVFPRP